MCRIIGPYITIWWDGEGECFVCTEGETKVEPHTVYTAKLKIEIAKEKIQGSLIHHPFHLLSSWKDWKAVNSLCAASFAARALGEFRR